MRLLVFGAATLLLASLSHGAPFALAQPMEDLLTDEVSHVIEKCLGAELSWIDQAGEPALPLVLSTASVAALMNPEDGVFVEWVAGATPPEPYWDPPRFAGGMQAYGPEQRSASEEPGEGIGPDGLRIPLVKGVLFYDVDLGRLPCDLAGAGG